MIFIINKYSKYYYLIINNAKSRGLATRKQAKTVLGYVEHHHIVPESLGGSEDPINLVFLTAKEHFVCHHLLTKMCQDPEDARKMRFALHKMCRQSKNQQRVKITARLFGKIRKDFANDMSDMLSGVEKGPMAQDHRDSISESSKGHKKASTENMKGFKAGRVAHLTKLNASKKGVPKSEEAKKNMRKPKKNKGNCGKATAGNVTAYDLLNKIMVRVTKGEFDKLKNIRYVGVNSKLRKNNE